MPQLKYLVIILFTVLRKLDEYFVCSLVMAMNVCENNMLNYL